MDPRVLVISGPDCGHEQPLRPGEFSIGRSPSNDLRLMDPCVSRHHCQIRTVEGESSVHDLETRNGTFVNGVPVAERTLHHRDLIEIGRSALLFLSRMDDVRTQEDDGSEEALADTTKMGSFRHLALADIPERLGRMARDLNALLRISSVINSLQNVDALQRTLLKLIYEVVPAERGVILLIENRESEAVAGFSCDRKSGKAERLQLNTALIRQALEHDMGTVSHVSAEAGSVLCTPLVVNGIALGVIYLVGSCPESFEDDHVSFLNGVSGIAAVALQNALTIEALRADNALQRELQITHKLVGHSARMRRVFQFIERAARVPSTVLLRGESGTGKELVAQAIHVNSSRAEKPFVAINCAAVPEALLESELFGHEKGAFTGADREKKGKFEVANGGTVFLDEIGDMPAVLQAKLLRVLQEREFERIGGTCHIRLDIRLIAATNADLESAIKSGRFREDLYYRLNVLSITMPPLRERRDDIPELLAYFLAKHASDARTLKGVSPQARALLLKYDWPGNVRELENVVERAVVLGSTELIVPEDLPEHILETQPGNRNGHGYHGAVNDFKRNLILAVLKETNDNYTEAARRLEIHPNNLHRLIRNFGLRRAKIA